MTSIAAALVAWSISAGAHAQASDESQPAAGSVPAEVAPPAEAPVPVRPRPPYTMPFTLRPAVAPQVVRLDTVIDANANGVALVPLLTAALRVHPEVSPMVRIGMTSWFPSSGGDRSVFLSPQLGLLYTPDVGFGLRPSFFAGLTVPLGSGEGDPAPSDDGQVLAAGRRARMALDHALFATNFTVLIAGAGLAWLYEGLTVQLDLTILYGAGSRAPLTSPYDDFTNVVAALFVAYAVLPWLSFGAELRHQHLLDVPRAVAAQAAAHPSLPQQEYQTSLGGGVRFRIPIVGAVAIPLGLSYTRGLNGWMWARDHNVFQIDVPIVL